MTHPVSIKGIVTVEGEVVLLRNHRDEWELPGGRPDPGESEHDALARELREELGIAVEIRPAPIDRYEFSPIPGRVVSIVTYACTERSGDERLLVSDEHTAVGRFAPADAVTLPDLPAGYRASIRRHFGL